MPADKTIAAAFGVTQDDEAEPPAKAAKKGDNAKGSGKQNIKGNKGELMEKCASLKPSWWYTSHKDAEQCRRSASGHSKVQRAVLLWWWP